MTGGNATNKVRNHQEVRGRVGADPFLTPSEEPAADTLMWGFRPPELGDSTFLLSYDTWFVVLFGRRLRSLVQRHSLEQETWISPT